MRTRELIARATIDALRQELEWSNSDNESLRQENVRLRGALEKILDLPAWWNALPDDNSSTQWVGVGIEAHKVASHALR